MNLTLNEATLASYLFIVLLGAILLRQAFLLTRGVPASAGRLVALPVFYVAIYAIELAGIGFAGIGSSVSNQVYISFAIDAALVAAGTFVAYGYTLRHVQLYQNPGETDWSYRLGALLPVLYVVLFFSRVAIETVVLGETPFEVPTTQALAEISSFAL